MSNTLPRDVMQMVVEKLDRNQTTPTEAKEFVLKTYNVALSGRTREQVVRSAINAAKQED